MDGPSNKWIIRITRGHLWGIWISVLLIFSWMDKLRNPIPYIGDLALILLSVSIGGYVLLASGKRIYISVLFLLVLFLFFISIYCLGEMVNPIGGEKNIGTLCIVMIFLIGAVYILPGRDTITTMGKIMIVLSLANFILWAREGLDYPYQGIFIQKNVLGGICVFGIFFILASRYVSSVKAWYDIGLVVSLIVLLVSGDRTAWLVLLVAAGVFLLWRIITAKRWLAAVFFILIFAGCAGFVYLYIALSQWDGYPQLAALVLKYTGQNIYTGRQIFWPILVDAITNQPWGYGPGARPELFLPTTLSSHNLYIQIALQVGYIGLFAMAAILFFIWMTLTKNRDDCLIRLSGSFLIGSLIHESFEVSLTQNNLTIGIMMWGILAIGLGRYFMHLQVGQPQNPRTIERESR